MVEKCPKKKKEFQLYMQNPIRISSYALLQITFMYELF